MKKTRQKKVIKTEEVTEDILCNHYGGSCQLAAHGDHKVFGGLLEAEIDGGYDSIKLDDLYRYRFSLCENCLRKLFNKFKIPVEVRPDFSTDFIPETKLRAAEITHQKILNNLDSAQKTSKKS